MFAKIFFINYAKIHKQNLSDFRKMVANFAATGHPGNVPNVGPYPSFSNGNKNSAIHMERNGTWTQRDNFNTDLCRFWDDLDIYGRV